MAHEAGNNLEQIVKFVRQTALGVGYELSCGQISELKDYFPRFLEKTSDWQVAVCSVLIQYFSDKGMPELVEKLVKQDIN